MANRKDLTGSRVGELLLLERKRENNRTFYYCICSCGNKKWIRADVLLKAKSCGCERLNKLKHNKNLYNAHLDKNIIEETNLSSIKREEPTKANKSGYIGVSYDNTREKWVAQISFKKKHYFLGRFDKKEDAIKARKAAKEKLHKKFLMRYKQEDLA